MEEVDNIIIHSLRQIGCDVDDSISNLASFDTELVVKATVRCLDVIKPGLGLNPILPANMAARFRMGATLAQCCSDLGYKNDIGYQTFLYSAESDLRRVFMFLIEKLPKESEKTISEPITQCAQLEKLISSAIASQISVPWLPYYCHKKRSKYSVQTKVPYKPVCLDTSTIENDEDYQNYAIRYKLPIIKQVPHIKQLVPSVISSNSKEEYSSALTLEEKIDWLNTCEYEKSIETSDTDPYLIGRLISGVKLKDSNPDEQPSDEIKSEVKEEETEKIEEVEKSTEEQEIEKLKSECEELKAEIEESQIDVKKLETELKRLQVIEQKESQHLEKYQEESRIKLKAYELLENGEENVKKLEEAIEASTNKLISLANQWEKHRLPLIEKYREEREKYFSKASASQKKIDELRMLEKKEKELREECRNKDQQYTQLVAEVQKLPKEVNRSAYTQRILEIINNVRKQKNEIDKVLADTREIQKEINTLTGRLERSFAVVDELIFRDARTNEISRKAYKLLATLHSDCSELVKLVEETGATIREIRDLEEQVDSESAKNIGANLERITADLKQMRQETATLTAQLESKNST